MPQEFPTAQGRGNAHSLANKGVQTYVLEEFDGLVSELWIRGVVERTLASDAELASFPLVEVAIVDDATVRSLNVRHRGLDETTDVLSFSLNDTGYGADDYVGADEQATPKTTFAMPPGMRPCLGEVVISYPQALRQAEQMGHTIERELAHLLAHGVLHLLGHDHEEPWEEAVMEAHEAKILSQVMGDE